MKIKFTLAFTALLLLLFSTAHAQNTVFTSQGRVTDNGTNFTGTGQFQFALVTSSNANHQWLLRSGAGQLTSLRGVLINMR